MPARPGGLEFAPEMKVATRALADGVGRAVPLGSGSASNPPTSYAITPRKEPVTLHLSPFQLSAFGKIIKYPAALPGVAPCLLAREPHDKGIILQHGEALFHVSHAPPSEAD